MAEKEITPSQFRTLDHGISLLAIMVDIQRDRRILGRPADEKLDKLVESHASEVADYYLELVDRI